MIADIKIKKFGERSYRNGKINLPDSCREYLNRYKLEVIEMEPLKALCVYFMKEDVDFYSHTIYNYQNSENLREGFKTAFEKLKSAEELNDDNTIQD